MATASTVRQSHAGRWEAPPGLVVDGVDSRGACLLRSRTRPVSGGGRRAALRVGLPSIVPAAAFPVARDIGPRNPARPGRRASIPGASGNATSCGNQWLYHRLGTRPAARSTHERRRRSSIHGAAGVNYDTPETRVADPRSAARAAPPHQTDSHGIPRLHGAWAAIAKCAGREFTHPRQAWRRTVLPYADSTGEALRLALSCSWGGAHRETRRPGHGNSAQSSIASRPRKERHKVTPRVRRAIVEIGRGPDMAAPFPSHTNPEGQMPPPRQLAGFTCRKQITRNISARALEKTFQDNLRHSISGKTGIRWKKCGAQPEGWMNVRRIAATFSGTTARLIACRRLRGITQLFFGRGKCITTRIRTAGARGVALPSAARRLSRWRAPRRQTSASQPARRRVVRSQSSTR